MREEVPKDQRKGIHFLCIDLAKRDQQWVPGLMEPVAVATAV